MAMTATARSTKNYYGPGPADMVLQKPELPETVKGVLAQYIHFRPCPSSGRQGGPASFFPPVFHHEAQVNESIDDLTVEYEENGQILVKQIDKEILPRADGPP